LQQNTAKPEIDLKALETFWMVVNERHHIYLERQAGKSKPWSNDPIFQEWKFCNIFRQLDAQSQWLIKNVIEPHKDDSPGLLLFNIFAFRAFNRYQTYELLSQNNWIKEWSSERAKDALYVLVSAGGQLTSGAYMIRGYLNKPKWESIPDSLSRVWQDRDALVKTIRYNNPANQISPSIEYTVNLLELQKYWGWGPFTCYQIALDLTYTPILEHPRDLNDWCVFGPGAIRGLEAIFPGIKPPEYLEYAKSLVKWQGDWLKDYMPAMNLQDVEFSLCEFQKYWRIMSGVRGKERYNGKAS
jgi:hypothetical protein